MIRDLKSSNEFAEAVAPQDAAAGTINSVSVDHSKANSATFFSMVSAVTGTVDMKLQYSDDNTTWTDDTGESGNNVAITQLSAAGVAQVDVFNPIERYSRAVVTVGGTSATLAVASVLGPLRSIGTSDT